MHWLANRLFSTNRQKCQQFSTICPGNWETSRVRGRRQNFLDWIEWPNILSGLNQIFILSIAYTLQAFSPPQTWQTNTAFLTMGSTAHWLNNNENLSINDSDTLNVCCFYVWNQVMLYIVENIKFPFCVHSSPQPKQIVLVKNYSTVRCHPFPTSSAMLGLCHTMLQLINFTKTCCQS